MKKILVQSIKNYQENTVNLFKKLENTLSGKETDPNNEALEKVVASQLDLENSINLLREHQRIVAQIEKLDYFIKEEDQILIQITDVLLTQKNNLSGEIKKAESEINLYSENKKRPLDIESVIQYARRITKFTAAPPNYDPANSIVPAEPPYPGEVLIRAGLMNQDEGISVEKNGEIGIYCLKRIDENINSFEDINPIISHFGPISTKNNEDNDEVFDFDDDANSDI